jgi:hypothetical protein
MITSGRRAKRPDGSVYRTMRRQNVAGRTLLEGPKGARRRRRDGIFPPAGQSLTVWIARLLRR